MTARRIRRRAGAPGPGWTRAGLPVGARVGVAEDPDVERDSMLPPPIAALDVRLGC